MSNDVKLTLEVLRHTIREELDIRILKTEKLVRDVNASIRRHDNRFDLVDSRLTVIDDNGRAILERLNAIEEALDIEARETGGTIGERLTRLETQVADITMKLKAG